MWSGKARMSQDERREYLDSLLTVVRDGAVRHRDSRELRELRDKLQHARLGLEVVRSD